MISSYNKLTQKCQKLSISVSYFLKLEFNEENLQFWIECERYKTAGPSRLQIAESIIRKYIGDDAEMPVNLTSALEESALTSWYQHKKNGSLICFHAQQKHIYDLMKFDPYPRFIRSEHYRKLVQMNITQKTVSESDISRVFQKRPDGDEKKRTKKSAFQIIRNAVHIPSSAKKERRLSTDRILSTNGDREAKCFVHFSDGKNIVVRLQPDMLVSEVFEDLRKRFGMEREQVEWVMVGETHDIPLSMEANSTVLRDKHIRAEMRVTFRLGTVRFPTI